jgi:hypothetical protein
MAATVAGLGALKVAGNAMLSRGIPDAPLNAILNATITRRGCSMIRLAGLLLLALALGASAVTPAADAARTSTHSGTVVALDPQGGVIPGTLTRMKVFNLVADVRPDRPPRDDGPALLHSPGSDLLDDHAVRG